MPARKKGPRLKSDELPKELVEDFPQDLRHLRVVSGFLGDSAVDGYCRVYLNPELSAYFEIEESAIVLRRPFPKAPDGIGGSLVWFEPDAEISLVETRTQTAAAEFMAGDIIGAFMRGIGPFSVGDTLRALLDDDDPTKPKSFEYKETCYGKITRDYCESRDDVCTIYRCSQSAAGSDDDDCR